MSARPPASLRASTPCSEQLPAAIKQAHERIIGKRPVPNAEKILSVYEPDVQDRGPGQSVRRGRVWQHPHDQ
ncbi:MAG: hypothetical protein J6386_10025 [Candidatus Synoicihabitans palmerolidicus]|nr:hypothetical protein [Candidatus Synoicihabitans palmerolidicus]